jgi:hypothetical protein
MKPRSITNILRGEFPGEDKPYKEVKCICGFVRNQTWSKCPNCGKTEGKEI